MRQQIRGARTDDLGQIIEMNRQTGLSEWPEESYREAIGSEDFLFVVIEVPDKKRNRVAGFALATVILDDLEILKLAVKPSWQGRGLGSALLQKVLEGGKERGCRRCLLEVNAGNQAAINLYRRYDFIELYRRKNYYSRPLRDALVMGSRLDKAADGKDEKGTIR